ncbi:murein biosynthesis integral membrane protein MurJ [Aliikangiella sp. IMCC44359]|uniref:murein biosynthesis integral membrane protein MurJ n=1 Tax=Aliikangiella sp. IMCC44359 TaxID=3459125 RepID=UPI00403B027B
MSHLPVLLVSFLGKIIGVGKSLFLAAVFGTAVALDAFNIAYILPFALPEVLKGIVSNAFIPRFMRSVEGKLDTADWSGINSLFTGMLLFLCFFSFVLYLLSNLIVSFFAFGAEKETQILAADLLRIMALIMPILGVNAILTTLASCFERFLVASTESLITNSIIIIGILSFHTAYGIYALAYSLMLGFIIYSSVLIYSNFSLIKSYLRFTFNFSHPDFVGSAKQMLPLSVGYLGAIAMTIVDTQFVSLLSSGAISALNYALMIASLPLETFTQSVIVTHYPRISRYMTEKNQEQLEAIQVSGLKAILFFVVPSSAVLFFYSEQIVSILLQRGSFDKTSVELTSGALTFFSFVILARSICYFNYRFLHAANLSWHQVVIGLLGVVTNVIFNFLLYKPMGLAGIALATAIAMTQNLIVSSFILDRKLKLNFLKNILVQIALFIPATVLMLVTIHFTFQYCLDFYISFSFSKLVSQHFALLTAFVLGSGLFLVVTAYQGIPEAVTIAGKLKQYIRKLNFWKALR